MEKNGKGKEYSDGKLSFEGEYLNGEKNGIQYDNKGNKYEIKNGNFKIKQYDHDGNILFEIEKIKGVKDFIAIYTNGKLILETDYINCKSRHYYFNNGNLEFEGG